VAIFCPALLLFTLFLLIKFRKHLLEDAFYNDFQSKLKDVEIEKLKLENNAVLTENDVKSVLESIPEIDKDEIEPHYKEAHKWLLANGIHTASDLSKFAQSTAVIHKLAELYIQELGRPQNHPLDPVGFAMYGSALYRSGLDSQVVFAIRRTLQNSPEKRALNL
jgi:GTP1/Obg family GTP-binding protein